MGEGDFFLGMEEENKKLRFLVSFSNGIPLLVSFQVESPYSRPVEGGTTTDSGVSISGDTISSPDSEATQQAAKPVSCFVCP